MYTAIFSVRIHGVRYFREEQFTEGDTGGVDPEEYACYVLRRDEKRGDPVTEDLEDITEGAE